MRDERWQEVLLDPASLRPDILEHLKAENAYTEQVLAPVAELTETLFAELKGKVKDDDATVPVAHGDFETWRAYPAGAQHPVYLRRRLGSTDETVLVDGNQRALGHAFYHIAQADCSPDHRLVAWTEDTVGSESYALFVRDLETGEVSEPVADAFGEFCFSADSHWLFWTWRDENSRPAKVFRRPAPGGVDTLVYEERDPGFFLTVSAFSDRSFVVLEVENQETSETWLIPGNDPTAAPRCVRPRDVGLLYWLAHGDAWFVLTNREAEDFLVAESRAAWPSDDTWQTLVPHCPGILISGIQTFAGYLVRTEREEANSRVVVRSLATGEEQRLTSDEQAYSLALEDLDYDSPVVRYTLTSPTTSRQTWDRHLTTGESVLRHTQEVPSGHDPSQYVVRRLNARSADGALVPVTVLHRRGLDTATAPVLLFGYGSYGFSMEPSFSVRQYPLVDRGWIWATAHVRGGSEKGRAWFLAGRKEKKVNTFFDFIASAEALTAHGYGRPGGAVAWGASAGGMLVGAVLNLRPDLWAGAIADVPFVDVLTTMCDDTLPLTPVEWPEWGNPLKDRSAYECIAAYSPYDKVAALPYPPVLAKAGLTDPRVTYWEPAKWVARLREFSTSRHPVLLKTNLEAGHGGGSGRYEFLHDMAYNLAFAVWAHRQM
jgi:oligopeptidase B